MFETLSPYLQLPLPHPDNCLAADVLNIRDAFTSLDQKIAELDEVLHSDVLTLDRLQQLAATIKIARNDIDAAKLVVSSQIVAQNHALSAQLAAHNTEIAARLAAQNDQVAAQLTQLSALVYAGL